ncbi:MYG1 family protein [Clostridium sp. DJ247]|uniref:MYG1 family protein n=1 Tax=Clostridium sp. DJ247 TaxID=2726188 RepID=UPI001629FA82|nr:MYG1 family protein [Clostridium sp. DJ247]MBC2582602.1 MYG1 family protein [Clostridium sp. DJ247]
MHILIISKRIFIKEGDEIDTQKSFKRVGTHDGRFHADEVMATSILKEIFQIELVRTRDIELLDELDIVYDVGGGEFDHHGIKKVYREDGIPFAACGLIWNKFGRDVVRLKNPALNEEEIESVIHYVDRVLIEGIDALDNGVRINDGEIPIMSISSIISGFNPFWSSEKSEDDTFNEAVKLASIILNNTINFRFSVLKSREYVERAYENRRIPEILVLETYCPYREALQDIDDRKEVLFIVYPRKDSYALQTVRGTSGEDLKQLPEAWAGKRDDELADITGVHDAVFCHTGRFIAVAKSFEGIIKLAKLSIDEPEKATARGFFRFIAKVFSRR